MRQISDIEASQEKRKEARPILQFHIAAVISLNNFKLGDFVDHIYPIALEIKDTTDTARSASYLNLHLKIDNKFWFRTKLYDKRDDLFL